jgi:hypothetical protein
MSKLRKLVKNPGLFFTDMVKKRMPANKVLKLVQKPAPKKVIGTKSALKPKSAANEQIALPEWFNSTLTPELKTILNSGKPVFLYIPWIEYHTNILMDKLNQSDEYIIAPLDIFIGNDNANVRKSISKFIRENPHIYRKMLASRIIPLHKQIKGVIFSFDWAPVMRVAANLCEELQIPKILIPHESVFADKDKYYLDVTAGANVPVADVILGWGNLQKTIFTERGFPVERFISVGSPKFDTYYNYQPQLTKKQFSCIYGLDKARPIILFATQPLDSQFDQSAARIAQRNAISDVLEYCNKTDSQLIVRMPPSKDRILNMALTKKIEESPNACIDDSICYLTTPEESIYHSNMVVSINSTMLFEAMLMGKPSLSTKYLEFEQIWNNAGIPAANNKNELFTKLEDLLTNEFTPDSNGLKWAENLFTASGFDGKATERIINFLNLFAKGNSEIAPRKTTIERVLFDENDNSLGIIGIPSNANVSKTTQLYLKQLMNSNRRKSTREGLDNITKLASIDIFLQWGLSGNNFKQKQNNLRKALGRPLLYIEDGFIRSVGIGLSGTPALSIILDNRTAYYDATKESRLQDLLENGENLTIQQKQRAHAAIRKIVDNRISKYNHAPDKDLEIGLARRKKILLVDQRYGDQSVFSGLADDNTFQKMLNDAVEKYADHDIIIKRHPDAIKGGKSSYFSDSNVAHLKNNPNVHLIDFDVNPHALFDIVDEVFVATSGMGFEALMAGKKVHCYGAPFYSGWGATEDHLELSGRTRKRSVEDIFHFAYIVLSRYYSPSLKSRCTVEELVDHIVETRKD